MSGTAVKILVWRGNDGRDFKKTRHVALFLPEIGKQTGDVVDITGPPQLYEVRALINYDPVSSIKLTGWVDVAEIPKTAEEVRDIAMKVPANNNLNGWNCQNWVGEALQRFVDLQLITAAQRSDAVGKMVDILLEAQDDQP